MSATIKISSPATKEFWEIPVLFEDEHLLALDKPAGILTSPDRHDPDRPSLTKLLHAAIAAGKPWARERGLTYLTIAHRLDLETSGVLLLAKSKPVFVALANLFGADMVERSFLALVLGTPAQDQFEVDAAIAPHPVKPGRMHIDRKRGKHAKTRFEAAEKFYGSTLLRCHRVTSRRQQICDLPQTMGWPIAGDMFYDGQPLYLSRLKDHYRLKGDQEERPLLGTPALHAERLAFVHPVTGQTITITAEWPKDLKVAVKYLRRYAPVRASNEVAERS